MQTSPQNMPDYPRLRRAGEAALTILLGEGLDPSTNERAVALAHAIDQRSIHGVRDVVPAYRSTTVYFDPLALDGEHLAGELLALANSTSSMRTGTPRTIDIPVCYGGEMGPDLEEVARLTGKSPAEVIALHHSVIYRVYMLGFLPGFPYLGSVPPAIRVPRLAEPRNRVPAGSVAVAGEQAGIYPIESPGGWRILGRTPHRLFEAARAEPCLLAPGDRVRFVPIDDQTFRRLSADEAD
jgi:KipI family sensor histidine kinase inhibitor